jgi:phospholipid transport system substrate-binding protein
MFKTLLILVGLSITSQAIVESQIQAVMNTKVAQVLNILQNKTLTQIQKEKESIKVMDTVFDYTTMAKISLGKKWKTLNSAEKKQFNNAFEHKIKHSYIDKLRLYDNQKVITRKIKKIKSTRITLESQIIGKAENYKVLYLFYKNKKTNQWYIYDVRLAGVSIIQTYRKQFTSFLKPKSFQALLKSL